MDAEKKFKAFISMILGFLVLPLICTTLKIDVSGIPKFLIIACWLGSAHIIAFLLGVYK